MSVDDFAILAFVDPIGIVTTPSGMEIIESQGHGTGPNFKLYTQILVLGPASYPVSHWPCPGRASHAWE